MVTVADVIQRLTVLAHQQSDIGKFTVLASDRYTLIDTKSQGDALQYELKVLIMVH